jgi:diguanylate cyclase (GGDEF)-like protein
MRLAQELDVRPRLRRFSQARLAVAPSIGSPRAMALTAGLLYMAAGIVTLVAFSFPHQPGVHAGFVRSISLGGIGTGAALLWQGHRLPRWSYHLLLLAGNAFIVVGVIASGGGATSVACTTLFVFVAVDVFFFFAWPWAILHLAITIGACVGALAAVGALDDGQAIITPGVLITISLVVGRLVRAADDAEVDPLTGLLNRRGVDRVLTEALDRAAATGTVLSLALLDIDHFKLVNDSGGHISGDRLLRSIANSWRSLSREHEVLGRYGGDEFALVLQESSLRDAATPTERLRTAVPGGMTCSAGIAAWEPGDTLPMLLARADAALYDSKRAGRNRTSSRSGNRAAEAMQLRQAIADGELRAFYQPVVDLRTGVVTGVEALVRWLRPGPNGPQLIAPDSFIPLAEESGVIGILGAWMLKTACTQAALWSSQGAPLIVNVNVSGRELVDAGYADSVLALLADVGLPPSQLVLEVTESALEGSSDQAMQALSTLRSFGVRIALDDFGTGYSSLSRLDRLPVDIVKIDRSFVMALPPDTTRAPLIAAIIALAGAMGLRVVAEGIEAPHQALLLETLGCDDGQGYWLGRPLPAHQVDLSRRITSVGANSLTA